MKKGFNFDEALRESDERMYSEKNSKKKQRS